MRVEVSPYCINVGARGDEQWCPIALALRYENEGLKDVMVGEDFAKLYFEDGTEQSFGLSRAAQRFIVNFDTGRDVSPSTFILKPQE